MDMGLPPLSWSSFLQAWDIGWLGSAICLLLLGGYAVALTRSHAAASAHPRWRTVCFVAGVVLLWLSLSSGLAAYGQLLFWVHMLLHLTLITVVPALLVLGHPITVVRDALGPDRLRGPGGAALRGLGAVALHPVVGLAAYTAVIVGTHLTSFMDHMDASPWLEPAEQALYVLSGWMLLTPLLGDEPIRSKLPMLGRVLLLVLAMVPDTIVGIVLLQTGENPYPRMFSGTSWGPSPLADVQTGGAIMWVGGDGLMMALAMGLVVTMIAGRGRERLLGSWIESVRSSHLTTVTGVESRSGGDVDEDQDSLEAYNRMLRRLGGQ